MVYIHNGILLSHKKNKIMPFAARWMQPEILILSQSERERQIPCNITYMWNLKCGTNEPIYRTETDSQTWRTDLRLTRARGESVGLVDANCYT